MTVLSAGNSKPLVAPPSGVFPQEVIDGPNNAVYGSSPPVGASFTLIISTTFSITSPLLQLTFTGPSGQTFIANSSDFFIGQDTLTLGTQYPPNTYLEYTPSSPSLFNQAGDWTVTLSLGNQGYPTVTYHLGIGGFLPPSAIENLIPTTGPYTARGVHFPNENGNTTLLTCSSLGCVDNGLLAFSFWIAGLGTGATVGCSLFITDPNHEFSPLFGTEGNFNVPVIQMNWSNHADTNPNQPTKYWNNLWIPTTGNMDLGWHHYLGAFFTNVGSGGKFGVLYIDDVFQTPSVSGSLFSPPAQTDNGTGAFIQPMNGLQFNFGGDGTNVGAAAVSAADVWIAPGFNILYIDPKNNLTYPFIAESTRRIFTSIVNKTLQPNNPVTFPGAKPPTVPILFTGGASSFGANFGSGGSFSLTGPLIDVIGPGGIPV